MKQLFLLPAILILLMSACSPDKKDEVNFSFNVSPDSEVLFSELFDNAEYRLMLANDSTPIKSINQLRVSNRYLGFIVTETDNDGVSKTLYVLNKGKFDLKIKLCAQGNDPYEYMELTDYSLSDEKIKFLDKIGRKILVYDYEGTFLERINIPYSAISFYDVGDGVYWFYNDAGVTNDHKYQLVNFNWNNGSIIGEYLLTDRNMVTSLKSLPETNFSHVAHDLFFYSFPEQIIYSLNDDTFHNAYTFGFGEHNAPNDYYKQHFSGLANFVNKTNKLGYVYYISNFGVSDDNLVLSFMQNKVPYIAFGNTQTNYSRCGNILVDDINHLKGFKFNATNQLYIVENNLLFMLIDAQQLINSCDNQNCKDFIDYNKLTTDSKPLLLICTLKEQFDKKN